MGQYGFDECMGLSFSCLPLKASDAHSKKYIAEMAEVIQVAGVDSAANGLHLKILTLVIYFRAG